MLMAAGFAHRSVIEDKVFNIPLDENFFTHILSFQYRRMRRSQNGVYL